MADTKISALPASTTPLAGTEVLPIVQSGATKKVSVADLTAGRAISATQVTLTTGSVVIGTSGQGIDFSATPGTGTSELLSDYEEGTWTPSVFSLSGAITSFTSSGTYTKVGRQVTVNFDFTITNNGTGAAAIGLSGLPFSTTGAYTASGDAVEVAITGYQCLAYMGGASAIYILKYDWTYPGATNARIVGTITYPV